MKIIVCGAGNVGRSLVSYLALGNNDIVVIDKDQNNLNALAKEFDIQPVLGMASYPEVLEKAGAADADMLVSVTNSDEVNMIACEVASALFQIPRKIARVDSQDFLSPLWAGLFNEAHIATDLVISPAYALAEEISFLLKMPGMIKATPLLDNKVYLLAFRCVKGSLSEQMSIRKIENTALDSKARVACVIHNGNSFVPAAEYKLQPEDVLYVLVSSENSEVFIRELGLEKSVIEKLVIFGGNEISRYLAAKLEKDDNILSCRIIEENSDSARSLAKKVQNTAVIHGDLMSDIILEEAGIDTCDATLSVTPHDKDNLLVSLLSKQHHVPLSFSLVNVASYSDFMENISGSILIDRSAVIVSSILQELRRARIRDAYSLGYNFGEIWEVSLSEDNVNCGQKIKDIDLPISTRICAVLRHNNLIFPDEETVLNGGDTLVLYVGTKGIKKAEKLFA